MSLTSGDEGEELAKQVLRYFLHHPQSADSLEGVARWRLLEETIHHTLTQTNGALEQLIAKGFLRVVSVPGSDSIYTLNPAKRDEAARYLGLAKPVEPNQ